MVAARVGFAVVPGAGARSSATMGGSFTWALVVALIGETSSRLVTRDRAECERLAAGLIHLRDAGPLPRIQRAQPAVPFSIRTPPSNTSDSG